LKYFIIISDCSMTSFVSLRWRCVYVFNTTREATETSSQLHNTFFRE